MISVVSELYNVVNSAYQDVKDDSAFSEFCTQAQPILALRTDSAVGPLISLAENLLESFTRGVPLSANSTVRFHESELLTVISSVAAHWRVQPRLRAHVEQLGLQAHSLLDSLYQWLEMRRDDRVVAKSYRLTDGVHKRALELVKEPLISARELELFIGELHDYVEHMRSEADRFALAKWPHFAASIDEFEAFVLIHETEL